MKEMNRRHFIKLISIFTALFPFLKPRSEDSYRLEAAYTNPNIENALKYDDPYEQKNVEFIPGKAALMNWDGNVMGIYTPTSKYEGVWKCLR